MLKVCYYLQNIFNN